MGTESQPIHGLFDSASAVSLTAAAHDLKNPLSTVHYLAASLRDCDIDLSEAERQEYLWRIQLTAQRGLQLIEGLTYMYNTSQLELDLEPVNVTHICEDVLHELLPLSRKMAQTIELHAPRSGSLALAHHTVLKSVITNLCDNALKHNPPQSHVALRIAHVQNAIEVSVRDNGPSLSKKDYDQLRDRLGKEVNPLAGRAGSSGLGLFIASQLTEAMSGSLELKRHQQTGVTFQIRLQPSSQLSLI